MINEIIILLVLQHRRFVGFTSFLHNEQISGIDRGAAQSQWGKSKHALRGWRERHDELSANMGDLKRLVLPSIILPALYRPSVHHIHTSRGSLGYIHTAANVAKRF